MRDPVVLHRVDPARNMARRDVLYIQPDLFGRWCFIREWGRIGYAHNHSSREGRPATSDPST